MDQDDRGGFRKGSVPFEKALRIAKEAEKRLWVCSDAVLIVGSIRRQQQIVGDVDLLVLPKDLDRTLAKLEDHGFVGGDRIRRKMIRGVLVEIYLAHDDREMGSMMIHTIGSKEFNQELRRIAKAQGWLLNQYGLFDGKGKLILQSPDERDFFDALGVPWRPPEERGTAGASMGAYVHPENRPEWHQPPRKQYPDGWKLEPLRKPDLEDEGKMVWYGPKGPSGKIATLLRFRDGGWVVTEYSDANSFPDPPSPIVSMTTFVRYEDLIDAVLESKGVEVPLDAIERTPDNWARHAAAVAGVEMDMNGGKVTWVDHLP